MEKILLVLVWLLSATSLKAEELVIDKNRAKTICSKMEDNWSTSQRLSKTRRDANNYLSRITNNNDYVILVEKGSTHYKSYSYKAFLLSESDFSFVHFEPKKKTYVTYTRSYTDVPSVNFLKSLFDIKYTEDVFMSLSNIPKDLEGTCYKVTMRKNDEEKSIFYLNSTLDIEKNRSFKNLNLSTASELLELLNFLVFYKLDK